MSTSIPLAKPGPGDHVKPSFNGDNHFQRELRRRIDAHFIATGQSPRDNLGMYAKTALILGVFAASYVGLVGWASTFWQGLLYAVVLGIATAAIGFNIQHDGGHQAFSRHRWINRTMAATLDLIGGSSYIWHWKHAHFHHSYVNIDGHDSDIDLGVLARLAPSQRHRKIHRWQHYYLWVLYAVTAIRWHLYGDFRDLVTGKIGERRFPRPRGWNLVVLIGGKLGFFTLAFGLPLLYHPFGVVLGFYLLVAAITGVLLALVFQLAHVVEDAGFPAVDPAAPQIERAWAQHQLDATVDFAQDSRLLSWLIGGLNFQIEHHLFCRVSHVHYRALAPLVAATCRDFGMPYRSHSNLRAGIASHYRWLKRMGQPLSA